jgi:hypothetical protein
VLRRLYMGREKDIISVGINTFKGSVHKGPIHEENIFLFPYQQKWIKWKMREVNDYLLKKIFLKIAQKKIDATIAAHDYDIMHIVNHGVLSAYPCREEYLKGKQLWVSFHDHYALSSSYDDTKRLWQTANRRLVISEALGKKYAETFGDKNFEIITDGLLDNEMSAPRYTSKNAITIYFGGLLHYDYIPVFKALETALNFMVKTEGIQINFIMRGVYYTKVFSNNLFNVEYRKDFVSDAAIAEELNQADILYLPIKFNNPDFYLYSLSTKMIGYLGAQGKIFYHGPANSAAGKLLKDADAAVCCSSLETNDVVNAIKSLIENTTQVSSNAKQLACNSFKLDVIQKKFWNN